MLDGSVGPVGSEGPVGPVGSEGPVGQVGVEIGWGVGKGVGWSIS